MAHLDHTSMRPWIGAPPRIAAPPRPGYALLAHERVDMLSLSVAGVVLIPVWAFAFVAAIGLLGGRTRYHAEFTLPTIVIGALAALLLVPLAHEIVHGLAALALGARPSFGLGAGFAYTTFQQPMGRWAYLTVGLAPLALLSAALVGLAARWDAAAGMLLLAAIANAAGAIGDLWMAWRILRLPRSAIFYDLADGFAALVPERD